MEPVAAVGGRVHVPMPAERRCLGGASRAGAVAAVVDRVEHDLLAELHATSMLGDGGSP
jgi:hypothetical protein